MLIKNEAIRGFVAKILSFSSVINKLVPKSKKKILLYSNTGLKDNLMVLFDYLTEDGWTNGTGYKIIVCTNDYKMYQEKSATNNSVKVKMYPSIVGIWAYYFAKYVFYYNGKIPVKPAKGQVVTNMWHGIPLKKIGRALNPNKDIDFSTHYLASTKEVGHMMCSSFGCDYSKILVCSPPRNDRLIFPKMSADFESQLKKYKHVVCWLPTFRNSDVSKTSDSTLMDKSRTGLPIIYEWSELVILNEFLCKIQCMLLIKLHPMESSTKILGERYSNIQILSDMDLKERDTDLYSVLSVSDGLITDYSSVYFDYLTINKPICFAIDDLKSYQKNRGFMVDDPLAIMPGEIAFNYKDLITFFENIADDNDSFVFQRENIANRFCGKNDGHNTSRMLEKLGI